MNKTQFTFFAVALVIIATLIFCILTTVTRINNRLLYIEDTSDVISDRVDRIYKIIQ